MLHSSGKLILVGLSNGVKSIVRSIPPITRSMPTNLITQITLAYNMFLSPFQALSEVTVLFLSYFNHSILSIDSPLLSPPCHHLESHTSRLRPYLKFSQISITVIECYCRLVVTIIIVLALVINSKLTECMVGRMVGIVVVVGRMCIMARRGEVG